MGKTAKISCILLSDWLLGVMKIVHCRTGSLEKSDNGDPLNITVHCRTGSLENVT